MQDTAKKGDEEHQDEQFIRSKNQKLNNDAKIRNFKVKIQDEKYINHAIQRIATDLTHFLLK